MTSEQALEKAKNILHRQRDAALVLAMAQADGVRIYFDPALAGTRMAGVFSFERKSGRQSIRLRPCTVPEKLARTLIHELRHYWQKKQAGITGKNFRGKDASLETRILVTRMMEADAFAFTRVMRRYLDKAKPLPSALLPKNKLAEKLRARFARKCGDLGGYDARAVRYYHARYTHPDKKPTRRKITPADAACFGIGRLRGVLRAGFDGAGADYMTGVSDRALRVMLLRPVSPAVRKIIRLSADFESAAAARGRTESSVLALQAQLHDRVQKLSSRKP